jgi:aryl-alcohol dehydrogenase-like predicted oxidoreductase
MINLANTDLTVYPLCLGGNVFGYSADKENSEAVLSFYADNGGNFIDTADMYSQWAPGHIGGESETIIGDWMKKRSNRSQMIIATKVGKLDTKPGLSPSNVISACEDSLKRLGSDFTPERLQESLDISKELNLASYIASQDQYNLMERSYESTLRDVLEKNNLSQIPFYGLARGFLTGKYRPGASVESVRATGVSNAYGNERGWTMLEKLDQIAKAKNCSVAAVALAWLRAQPTVSTPIASATKLEQIKEIMQVIELTNEELGMLSET